MAVSPRRSRHDASGAGGRGDAGGDRRRQDACRPAPLELSELTELAAEWDAGRSFSEPAGVEWPWAAATRRSQLSSSRGVDLGDAMDTGDDDLQSMLGSLLVRAEVANKETEDFQRAVKSLRSEARRHKAQADRYRSALGDLQRKHEQLQSETTALFVYNRELFSTAEDATTRLAKRATGDQPFWRRLQLATAGGRVWRAWRDLCVARQRRRVAMRIVYRRRAHRCAGAGFGLWKIATQVARFARSCLGVWRRASAQQIQSRERRANVVLLSVLSRRARRWRLAVMHVWQHTAVTNRRLHEQIGNAERELADKRRQASGSFIFAWRAQAVVAAKRRRASHRMLAKRRSRLLRCAILGWERQACGLAQLRSMLCRVHRRRSQRGAYTAWRGRALARGRWQREHLGRVFR